MHTTLSHSLTLQKKKTKSSSQSCRKWLKLSKLYGSFEEGGNRSGDI